MPLLRKAGDVPKRSLWQRIKDVALADVNVLARGGVKAGSIDALEELLLEADFGVPVTLRLVDDVKQLAMRGTVKTEDEFLAALRSHIASALRAGASDTRLTFSAERPTVIVVIGVNGAGKTTFIGKLAARLKREGRKVIVAAADTFRAGAIDQLKVWASRVGVDFIGGQPGGDPAAVAFDAVEAAVTRGADTVIVDTAGRLHTQEGLMEELRKVVRVVGRRAPGAPHESLLVLDGTVGQNALQQGREFTRATELTGLVVTKLDGTARGGSVVALRRELGIPVRFLGTGEDIGDLEPFDAKAFVERLLEE